jgi:hypothetical protein
LLSKLSHPADRSSWFLQNFRTYPQNIMTSHPRRSSYVVIHYSLSETYFKYITFQEMALFPSWDNWLPLYWHNLYFLSFLISFYGWGWIWYLFSIWVVGHWGGQPLPQTCKELMHPVVEYNQVEEDEMGGPCSTNGEKRNAYRLSVGKNH